MSYFAGHMKKLKQKDLQWAQIHNQRERESASNRDIDKSRTALNYDLANVDSIDYKERIKQRLKEGLKDGARVRKDSVLIASWVITSDKGFFDKIGEQEEKRFFEEAKEWFSKRFGRENIVFAVVHKDEKTPHMHLGITPITKDGRLSAKELFGRVQLKSIQDDFPKHMQKRGFALQRGIPGKQSHVEPVKWKNKQLIEQVKELGDRAKRLKEVLRKGKGYIDALSKEKERLERSIDAYKGKIATVKQVESMEEKNIWFRPEWVRIRRGDLGTLKRSIVQADGIGKEAERLRKHNDLLIGEVDGLVEQVREMDAQVKGYADLGERYRELKGYVFELEKKLGIELDDRDLKQDKELDLEQGKGLDLEGDR